VKPIVYANINYALNFSDESVADEHDLWLARYNGGNDPARRPADEPAEGVNFHPNPYGAWNEPFGGPRSDDAWSFWQYTSRGPGPRDGREQHRPRPRPVQRRPRDAPARLRDRLPEELRDRRQQPLRRRPGITTSIEAENYDVGGQDVSYSDTTADQNTGGVYRTGRREGVDLAADPADPANFRVTQTAAGEYVEYTIDVAAAGEYTLSYHVAQTQPGAAMHAEIDGQALPTLPVPVTGDADTFAPLSQTATLSPGQHVVRIAFDAAAGSGSVAELDRITIAESPGPTPTPEPTPTPTPGIVGPSAYVRGGPAATQNFGQAGELLVQRGRSSANTMFSYLRFDLSNVDAIPMSAKLRLTGRLSDAALPSLTTGVYSVGKTKTPFVEEQATFKKKPAAKKLRGFLTVTGTTDGTYELDLTAFLRSELAAGAQGRDARPAERDAERHDAHGVRLGRVGHATAVGDHVRRTRPGAVGYDVPGQAHGGS
jgi:hypothetical protein